MRKETADTDLDIRFLVFCCSSYEYLLVGSVFPTSQWMWGLFPGAHPQKRSCTFWLFSYRHDLCPTIVFTSSHSLSQLTLFLFSIPHSLPKRLFRLSSFQPIRTCYQFAADPFLFLIRASLIILLYFDELRHISAVPDAYAMVVKVNGSWNVEHAWYSPCSTLGICLYGFENNLGIDGFTHNWLCLVDEVFATQTKIQLSCNSTVINPTVIFFTKIMFGFFHSVKLVKHKSLN